jgi:hypothetical protein
MTDVKNEHEYAHSLKEDVFYPDHAPRTESSTFRRTKEIGHKAGLVCAISGVSADVEYHHLFCEEAFANAVNWHAMKAIALGQITRLPVLDLETDQPTGETFPVEQSLAWLVVQITRWRGFDWAAFDPAKPETFVDGMENMLPVHKKFHRAPVHGIHAETFPLWVFQAFPRVPGFVYSPDELRARHGVPSPNHAADAAGDSQ